MTGILKYVASRTVKPVLATYLTRTRKYRYRNIEVDVPPDVFHPGFFFTTHFLLAYLRSFTLAGKTLLEVGCGSGLIAIYAAKNGAVVTALDINRSATQATHANGIQNGVFIQVIESDLFSKLAVSTYDFIIINPPFFKKDPLTLSDRAWYCGSNHEYFDQLFNGLAKFMHDQTNVIMILSDGCDIEAISSLARSKNLNLRLQIAKRRFFEQNFIYKIQKGDGAKEQ